MRERKDVGQDVCGVGRFGQKHVVQKDAVQKDSMQKEAGKKEPYFACIGAGMMSQNISALLLIRFA